MTRTGVPTTPPRLTPAWAVPRGTEGVRIMTQAVAESMSAADCLAGTGLAEADLADEDAEIWAHQEFSVVRNIIARLGDQPGRGLEVGAFSTLGRTGIVGFAFLTSATVREGFTRALPYVALAPSHLPLAIDSDDAHDYLVADDADIPADIKPFIVERDLGGLAAVLRGADIDIAPQWIETTLDPARAERLGHTWSPTAEVRPNQHTNRIAFPGGTFDAALPQADSNTARVAERQCQQLLAQRLTRVGVAGQVRSRIMHDERAGFPSMQDVAAELHLDSRTLRRKLTSEGTSFRAVVAEVRRARAEQLLAGPVSIESIASQLGYAETASFTHAFTRWTGLSPSHFRAALRK
jgi:AraC-like DNA-binding protein